MRRLRQTGIDDAGLQVLVLESTPDGRPKRVQFRFSTPLKATDRLRLIWQNLKPVPWTPPPVGETITLLPLFSPRQDGA